MEGKVWKNIYIFRELQINDKKLLKTFEPIYFKTFDFYFNYNLFDEFCAHFEVKSGFCWPLLWRTVGAKSAKSDRFVIRGTVGSHESISDTCMDKKKHYQHIKNKTYFRDFVLFIKPIVLRQFSAKYLMLHLN